MTSSTLYRHLVDALCRQAGIADAAAVQRDGNLRVADVGFTLLPVQHPDGELLLMYGDFGPLPAHERETALQRLLELNLLMYGGEGPGFSFNRESGHVLFMSQLRLARATPDTVLGVLRSVALFAQRWRSDHFLVEEPAASMAGTSSARGRAAGTPFTRP